MDREGIKCFWDSALIRQVSALPSELIEIIRNGSNRQYLDTLTQAALRPNLWNTIFTYCEPLLAHISASICEHASLAEAIGFLGRTVPHASYLSIHATDILSRTSFRSGTLDDSSESLILLLGIYRLLKYDSRTFVVYTSAADIYPLLSNRSIAVRYLAINILQIILQGAEAWFEDMIVTYIGPDKSDEGIEGAWDDKMIDYRFLDLWEEQRIKDVERLAYRQVENESVPNDDNTQISRILPCEFFHPSTCIIGPMLLPRLRPASPDERRSCLPLIDLPSTRINLKSLGQALRSTRPILLSGLAGCGKTMLANYTAAEVVGVQKLLTLHLNEQSDAKLLVGIYTTGRQPGTFEWKPGVLTTAVTEGRWLFIEDLDRAPNEVVSTLLPLIERRELLIPSRKHTVYAHPNFRIIASVRTSTNHRGQEIQPLSSMIGLRHWQVVPVQSPSLDEQRAIVHQSYPLLSKLLSQIMAVYIRTSDRMPVARSSTKSTDVLRPIGLRALLKWCNRILTVISQQSQFTSASLDAIFLEAVDCFAGDLPAVALGPRLSTREQLTSVIAEELHIDPQRRDFLLKDREPQYDMTVSEIRIGRCAIMRQPQSVPVKKAIASQQAFFSTNPHTCRTLERVAVAIKHQEPLLLVGETGVGKTTALQQLAAQLGKRLIAFNLSQQSEAGDMLGGFKPVTARSQMVPLSDEFSDLFGRSFSQQKNAKFLEILASQLKKANWKSVAKLWQQALRMVDAERQKQRSRSGTPTDTDGQPTKKRRLESIDFVRWDSFASKVTDVQKRLEAGQDGFAFSFVEGRIVEAVRHGDWILLDEINLASPDTLEALLDLLSDDPSLLLTEAGNPERVHAAQDFRVFAAMNPATDVGKKDLPPGIRSRFTELYVESPDRDTKSLQSIVKSYLREHADNDAAIAVDVATLYQKICGLMEANKLVDGSGTKPHFSLRTLTRSLQFSLYAVRIGSSTLRRALYEGFLMGFTTFLDSESEQLVLPLLRQHLYSGSRKTTAIENELQKPLRQPSDSHSSYLQPYPGSKHWIPKGPLEPESQNTYIITPFVRRNLENLVRATCTGQFPVLIQGPTSSGKTSMIEYLAKRTGHKFVRINNHEYTDLQEYLGTYVSDSTGKLSFQEGVLVRALKEGSWVVLDELNLAPSDVLEALNRLLDDNRELFVPETQEIIRPAPGFQLFATQNPAGLYGGRKVLSRAFRNRFLELHFDDIPIEELETILHRRTLLPQSRCKRVVQVYRELSILRQEGRVFEQRNSFATLRDLFRWASRGNDTIEQLACNGFMLLAERVRSATEKSQLKEIIERVMSAKGPKVRLDEKELYGEQSTELQSYDKSMAPEGGIVWTGAMRRLYVLVSRAVANNEPVLLVGETGCGKTTVVQMLAEAMRRKLHIVNAHANTETGDLIGSQRPVRNRAGIEKGLRDLLLSMQDSGLQLTDASSTDDLLNILDKAVKALEQSPRSVLLQSDRYMRIQLLRTRWKSLFEWADGSLISAMRTGEIFLLDEINLADDSVLERVNSVLEPARVVLLAEKGVGGEFGTADGPEVVAQPGFQFLATMNPGGDYGKRELSPALRNRFTEIWVPPLQDVEDIATILSTKLAPAFKQYAHQMVAFAAGFKARFNTSASSTISVRDALAWTDFVRMMDGKLEPVESLIHGAAMVFIDTLGANPAGLMTLSSSSIESERQTCMAELTNLLNAQRSIDTLETSVDLTPEHLVIGPFKLDRVSPALPSNEKFSFQAPTTRTNSMRVARALQLSKPILLEGSPGVGKTALVTAIANACSVPLVRINLSEQTDLMDLFGSDVPVGDADAGGGFGKFAWKDAPLLTAMKTGQWALLDEMNLASQSVLEGLNSVIDHRGEAYIPEIGLTVQRHPHFRLFATQNPHHQGGGRKGLPASFVNRFTVVYADPFRAADMISIAQSAFPATDDLQVRQAVNFVSRLDFEVSHRRRFGIAGGPWEFNLRDVFRWLQLTSSQVGPPRSAGVKDIVDVLFSQRFRSESDRYLVEELLQDVIPDAPPACDLFLANGLNHIQVGFVVLLKRSFGLHRTSRIPLALWPDSLHVLQSMAVGVQQSWPIILSGPSGCGKTMLIQHLARLVGTELTTFPVNADTDAMDLVGGYEQVDTDIERRQARVELFSRLRDAVKKQIAANGNAQDLLEVIEKLTIARHTDAAALLARIRSQTLEVQIRDLEYLLHKSFAPANDNNRATFKWIDGVLVDALQTGKWLVLDNANLCPSSALDRLNGLLEPNGCLVINENSDADGGKARTVTPHANFRIFFTVDPRYGELSRAMRNRAIELHLEKRSEEVPLIESNVLQSHSPISRFSRATVLSSSRIQEYPTLELGQTFLDQLSLSDEVLLKRFSTQLGLGLYRDSESERNVQLSESDLGLVGHDSLRVSLLQLHERVSACTDYACVQVSRATLSSVSDFVFTQALRHAVIYDTAVLLSRMQHDLSKLKSNAVIMKRLIKAEKSMSFRQHGQESFMVTTLESLGSILWDWSHTLPELDDSTFVSVKCTIGSICSLWWVLLNAIQQGVPDYATLHAITAVGQSMKRAVASDDKLKLTLVSALENSTSALSRSSTTGQGFACMPLWRELRTAGVQSSEQLQALLDLETLTIRFDSVAEGFKYDLSELVSLRQSLSQALSVARSSRSGLDKLVSRVASAMPDLEKGTTKVKPHFSRTFAWIFQHFSTLCLGGALELESRETAELSLLALLPTSICQKFAPGNNSTSSTALPLQKLQLALPVVSGGDKVEIGQEILYSLTTVPMVTLANLDLLKDEIRIMGSIVSARTHLLCHSEIDPLDACLKQLTGTIIAVLARYIGVDEAALTQEQDAIAQIEALLASETSQMSTRSIANKDMFAITVATRLRAIQDYFDDGALQSNETLRYDRAATSWLQLGSICTELYIANDPFDPALIPQVEREIYRATEARLHTTRNALSILNQALLGRESSLRSRLLRSELEALGDEPTVDQVYRPAISEIHMLHAELMSLRRIVQPLRTINGVEALQDSTFWSNLGLIRKRLVEKYPSYRDLTEPVVGFIDCIRVSQRLAQEATLLRQRDQRKSLASITPLHGATLGAWFSDESFAKVMQQTFNPYQRQHILMCISARSQFRPLSSATPDFRDLVELQFYRFYELWKKELSEGQRRMAANSSLYRYRGETELDEDVDEGDLQRLFPTFDDSTIQGDAGSSIPSRDAQEWAPRLANLHRTIFSSEKQPQVDILGLLNHLGLVAVSQGSNNISADELPMLVAGLSNVGERLSQSKIVATFDIYRHNHPEETTKLVDIVTRAQRRFEYLNQAWPEHATPVDAVRICEQILTLGHAEPLMKYLPTVEKLHATVVEWQKVASREFSAAETLEQITSLIIAWRRLELTTWSGLFEHEAHQCRQDALSWWYVAFESIVVASYSLVYDEVAVRKHTEGLLQTLSAFFESSGFGEFSTRMQLLRGFKSQLELMCIDNSSLTRVRDGLANFICYYGHFESTIADAMTKGRADLEVKVKDIIQMASWKDRNIDILRQSAKSSHKKLFRIIKRYRRLLAQPVIAILQGKMLSPSLSAEAHNSRPAVTPKPASFMFVTQKFDFKIPNGAEWPDRFRNVERTVQRMQRVFTARKPGATSVEEIKDFMSQLDTDVKELRQATPSQIKEENKGVIAQLKSRKRLVLSDVLKAVRKMGFKSGMSDEALAKQASLEIVLADIPSLESPPTSRTNNGGIEVALDSLIHTMPNVRLCARKHSDDLTDGEITRCIANLESMLERCVVQRKRLAKHVSGVRRLELAIKRLESFSSHETTFTRFNTSEASRHLEVLLPMAESVREVIVRQCQLSGHNRAMVIDGLGEIASAMRALCADFSSLPKLPAKINSPDTASTERKAKALVADLENQSRQWQSDFPELKPVLAQLSRWIYTQHDDHEKSVSTLPCSIQDLFDALLSTGNSVLTTVQNLEKLADGQDGNGETGWLVREEQRLHLLLEEARCNVIALKVQSAINSISRLDLAYAQELPSFSDACEHMMPIFQSFVESSVSALQQFYTLHFETLSMASKLAEHFTQLGQQGFCKPSEKPQDSSQEKGDVETGTGLGDGEGGEDISKDIGPNEDLSELAQEGASSEQKDEMEAEKDAVDMADEDMEGQIGSEGEEARAGEGDEGNGDDAEDGGEMDEEPGEVDDLGPSAVDEKFWDGEQKNEERDQKVEDDRGTADQNEVAAAQEERNQDELNEQEAQGEEHEEVGADEQENVARNEGETMESFANEQETLELPDNMEIEGKQAEDIESDFESVGGEEDAQETEEAPDPDQPDQDASAPDAMQLDSISDQDHQKQAQAFVGESATDQEQVNLQEQRIESDGEVQDVDNRLTRAHISQDDDKIENLTMDGARQLWSQHEANTRNLALILTEHLRLILHPTQATKMRGDFRTGKRLNIKRVIPYIASSFRRDKIWMRRSVPSKRSYQIMLAIDDSKSMSESESQNVAFDTLALVAKSLSMLEVGELCVVGFGDEVTVAQDFNTTFSTETGAAVFKHFKFDQTKTNVRRLLAESIELFRTARLRAAGAASELWQLQLIISDGVCEDHSSIRQLVRQANEERIMIVFVIVDSMSQLQNPSSDAVSGPSSMPRQSILDLQTAEFTKDAEGEMQLNMVKYLDTFPFNYYLIVRDVQELPGVLAGALKQWFAEVVESAF
ncbi:P-loop containing nucleoside triphosphate hydrolase protein [Polychaeton citri CBS 116435]|uniref:Midasin n=1 Tax=Polychaeton citri CBS 116435 TaxID=1314669 RepID=A0A9P4UUQ1_9PEZI|nr:P-loop containing nucleoside triphosphate hydrolase protein [Polychaeton citri CBS 116435]